MAMWGGRMRDPEGGRRPGRFQQGGQRARPMDPYRAGGPQGYMARVQRMNPGAAQAQGSGKANRRTVQAGAGGQQGGVPMGGQPGQGGVMSKLMQGVQGQAGQGGRSGKPNRQTVAAGQQPGQGGGQMFAGGSAGWAGGQGRQPEWGPGGPARGGGGRSGKPNRRTVPGNAGGGMIGRGGLRGRRRNQPKRQPNVLGTAAGRKKAAQAMGTKGGLLNKSPVKTMQRGAFEGVAR